MFQGETAITIDDKGRLSIPTAARPARRRAIGAPALSGVPGDVFPAPGAGVDRERSTHRHHVTVFGQLQRKQHLRLTS